MELFISIILIKQLIFGTQTEDDHKHTIISTRIMNQDLNQPMLWTESMNTVSRSESPKARAMPRIHFNTFGTIVAVLKSQALTSFQ